MATGVQLQGDQLSFLSFSVTGLWFALIGWFLIVASGAEAQMSRLAHALGGLTAADLMSSPAVSLPATLTVARGPSGPRPRCDQQPMTTPGC